MKILFLPVRRAIGPFRSVALLVFCAIAVALPGTGLTGVAGENNEPVSWSVTDYQGREIRSSALAGKVTILNFWATWCIPCIIENITLRDLMKKYKRNGLAVVGVSTDARSPAMLQAFVDKFKMNYPVAMANPAILSDFRVGETVPLTVVLDPQGRIARRHVGYVKKEDLERDIRPLLGSLLKKP